jgi:hypothetical protein
LSLGLRSANVNVGGCAYGAEVLRTVVQCNVINNKYFQDNIFNHITSTSIVDVTCFHNFHAYIIANANRKKYLLINDQHEYFRRHGYILGNADGQ